MEWTEVIAAAIGAVAGGGLTQIFTLRAARKKANEEVKTDVIYNLQRAVEKVYQPLIEQQNARISEQNEQIAQLTRENRELREKLNEQQLIISKLSGQMEGFYKMLETEPERKVIKAKVAKVTKQMKAEEEAKGNG